MKRKKWYALKKATPLSVFTMSYMSLFLVIVLIGIIALTLTVDVMIDQTIDAGAMLLEQIGIRLSNSFAEADYFAYTTNRLSSIQRLLKSEKQLDSDEVYLVRETIASLSSFQDSSALFSSYQIFLDRAGLLLEPGNAILNPEKTYGKGFSYGNLDMEQWRDGILRSETSCQLYPVSNMWLNGINTRCLLYTRPILDSYQKKGKMLFYIKENTVLELLKPMAEISSEAVALISSDGTVLVSTHDIPSEVSSEVVRQFSRQNGSINVRWNQTQQMLFYYNFPGKHFSLIALSPYSFVLTRAGNVLQPLLVTMLIMVLAGLGLTIYHLRTNRPPIQKTMELLQMDTGEVGKGMNLLYQGVRHLVSSNDELVQALDQQRFELRSAIVASLESDDTLDENELDILFSHVGIEPQGDLFRGVYLVMEEEDENVDSQNLERSGIHRAMVKELLLPYAHHISFLSVKDRSSFILLYSQNVDEKIDLTAFFAELYNVCRKYVNLRPSFYVGTECKKLCYLPHSLLAARQQMISGNTDLFLFIADHESEANDSCYYTDYHEKKLHMLCVTCHEDEIDRILQSLYEENQKRTLSRMDRQILYHRMMGTLVQVQDLSELPEELRFSIHKLELETFFDLVRSGYRSACQKNREKLTKKNEKLLENIMTYIEDNLTDSNLCLTSVALHFGITEKYLSAFIREKADVTFSTYVERHRIRMADEMLQKSSMTMEQIAQQIGYTNVKTFRRAYARIKGVTPSEGRRSHFSAMDDPAVQFKRKDP